MNKETFRKGEILHTKLETLISNKEKLVKAAAISDITVRIGKIFPNYMRIDGEYLNFNKTKDFLLKEIDLEIAKIQKEFDEL